MCQTLNNEREIDEDIGTTHRMKRRKGIVTLDSTLLPILKETT